MSATADSLGIRARISDPKPTRCAACFQGAEESTRFVDFDAAIDRGTFVNEHGAVLDGIEDLHLCEPCVRAAAEVLGLKPELHSRQSREIRRLELAVEHWRQYATDLERSLERRPEPPAGTIRRKPKSA